MRKTLLIVKAALLLACTGTAAFAGSPDLAAAVAKADRPAEAVALDSGRKPAEVLGFLGFRPGIAAADIVTGGGYWAEIMANAVGPHGSVTAYEPTQFSTTAEEVAVLDRLRTRHPELRLVRYPFEAFAPAPNSFDFAMISLNYHDLYWESERYHIPRSDPAAFVRALFAAMKPGGTVGVIDHVGAAGDTRAIVEAVHRIDPTTVKADFTAAGFVFEAESPLLANPADDHSKGVFDPAIRGRTDRFVFRFRKPG